VDSIYINSWQIYSGYCLPNFIIIGQVFTPLAELIVQPVTSCRCVNHGDTNHNRYMFRLVLNAACTYLLTTLITNQKVGQSDPVYWVYRSS